MKIENKYKKIWDLAKPYYEKGRPTDIDHIEWMMEDAVLLCEKEGIDSDLLLPLVILHDIGYAEVPKGNPFKLNLRKAHMVKGTKISEKILKELSYSQDLIDKVSYFVSVHDSWALGNDEIYKKDKILGSFNDLDFMWMATPKGFPALMKILNKTDVEMIDYLKNNEKLVNRPFVTKTAKKLFKNYLTKRLYDQK